mmetsp:Transcript_4675/g.6424  ORF Transcript_4675/g.6424 Transcript_4675/m.6424 type:complete len:327 (+) Transcript_4675:37-1017(+)
MAFHSFLRIFEILILAGLFSPEAFFLSGPKRKLSFKPPTLSIRSNSKNVVSMDMYASQNNFQPEIDQELGMWKIEATLDGEPWTHFLILTESGKAKSAMSDNEKEDPSLNNKRSLEGFWEVKSDLKFIFRVNRNGNSLDRRDLKFEGRLSTNGTYASGMVQEGSMDPECIGRFSLSPFLSFLGTANLTNYAQAEKPKPRWKMDEFDGDWNIINTKTGSIMQVHLNKEGKFHTIQGVGENKTIGGHWHIGMGGFQKNVDTIYMSCTRRGSSGVEMQADYMYNYWGVIEGSEKPEAVVGAIMYGQFEPAQIGRFEMRPTTNVSVGYWE